MKKKPGGCSQFHLAILSSFLLTHQVRPKECQKKKKKGSEIPFLISLVFLSPLPFPLSNATDVSLSLSLSHSLTLSLSHSLTLSLSHSLTLSLSHSLTLSLSHSLTLSLSHSLILSLSHSPTLFLFYLHCFLSFLCSFKL